ncbi:uncharacterized protein LOC128667681 [Microplitis demolitor]|uniref:uncharacterized protein LOC128667681 n=1 Tax=Microplitis demolitor TaxID=69319 RepID=UPI0004CD083E|nr:uncharacterized protein LOC128667681 [Microplitis demolitor]
MQAEFLFVLFVGVLANTLIGTDAQSSSQCGCTQNENYRCQYLSGNEKNRLLDSFFFTTGTRQVDFGTVWLLALFEKYPEYKEQFARFKDIPNYCLLNNKEFRQVSSSYTAAFNDLVRSVVLEDISNVELWRRWPCPLAPSGYSQKDKNVVQDVFIAAVSCNQDNFDQVDANTWNKAWSIIWRNYVSGARESRTLSQ